MVGRICTHRAEPLPCLDQDNAQSKSSYSQGSGASNNGGGGGGGPYDSGRSGGFSGAAAKDEDPFEATRRRIEKVKQEGAQPEPVSSAAFRAQAAAAAAADAEAAAAAPTMPFAGGADVSWPCAFGMSRTSWACTCADPLHRAPFDGDGLAWACASCDTHS